MAKANTGGRLIELDANERRQVAGLKRIVLDAAQKFGAIRERLADIAPKVVQLYNKLAAAHEGFTFVEYARLYDATVPTHAADRDNTPGYRNHRVYYTLQYMRRLVTAAGARGPRGQQGVRDSATDALARTLATVLAVVGEDQREQVWSAIQTEFNMTERIMTRLRKRVEATKPLFSLNVPKPVKVGKVLHMESAKTEAEPLTQPGRNVSIAERQKRAA